MNSFSSLCVAILLGSSSYFIVLAQNNGSYFVHKIEKGQSIYSIASTYNVSISEIIKLNPGCENNIRLGQELRIPQLKARKQNKQYHTIQGGETLYGLTVKYKVSADDICEANPGLSADNFQIGKVLVIPNGEMIIDKVELTNNLRPAVKPRCKEMHKVSKGETIFSITQQYGVTQKELISANPELKDGLSKGQFLCIPYPTQDKKDTATKSPTNKELFSNRKIKDEKLSVIRAALILPFMLDGGGKAESVRMVEYYEGFLMAVDSLKRSGTSVEIYTYDSGSSTNSITSILEKEELKKMNIIFGPLHTAHIKPLASFARKNNIKLVIPFTSKDESVFNNPIVFQANTPQSYLYSEVYEHFLRQFSSPNVIFIDSEDANGDKKEFIKGFQQELKSNRVSYKVVKSTASIAALKGALSATKENIFIPTSGTNATLVKCLPQLSQLVKNNPEIGIHLFGYPEWQTYTHDHLAKFYELDTYFYSSFYTNDLLPEAVNFIASYRKWYSKNMINTYPKYGMLGFDMGYYFLKALSTYGSGFDKKLSQMKNIRSIQTGFSFDRVNNWGGFINKKVFFVNFSKNYELVKLDFE